MEGAKFYKIRGGELATIMHEAANAYGEKHGLTQLDYCTACAVLFFQASQIFTQTEGVTKRIGVAIELGIVNELVKKDLGITLFHDITSSVLSKLFGVQFMDFLSEDEKKAFEKILNEKGDDNENN